MVELRYLVPPNTTTKQPRLQYRVVVPCVDIGGNLCPGDWTDWMEVPIIVELIRRTDEVPNTELCGLVEKQNGLHAL